MNIPKIKLSSGTQIPQLGLGLWKMKNETECSNAVFSALELGYRHFDTAQIYGNELFLGRAMNSSGVLRKDLFLTTKLWNSNQARGDIIPSFEKSLENLKTTYVDLFLIHFPVTKTRGPAWRVMEEIYKSGQAKAIGVSNYTIKHLEELLPECEIKPAVNQVELHVFLQQPELLNYCLENEIIIEAYSPLAHGNGLNEEILKTVAKKYNKSTAQIMIRWCIEQGTVPLPKSVNPKRIKENLECFDFELDNNDKEMIKTLEQNLRTCWDPSKVA